MTPSTRFTAASFTAARVTTACVLLTVPGLTQQELFQWTANDAAQNNIFGSDTAIAGPLALVGAKSARAAYVFDAVTGQQLHKLEALDGPVGSFGDSVALGSTYAAIGAKTDDDNGPNSGSAYVFDTATWQQQAKLLPLDGELFDFFGTSISISGNHVLVGATGDDDLGGQAGAAYLFDASTGLQVRKLLANDGASNHQFGWDVAVRGDYGLVGAGTGDAAYLFDLTTGQQLHKWEPGVGQTGSAFGTSVALDSGLAVVGAMHASSQAIANSGLVYVFDIVTGSTLLELTADDAATGDVFGFSVSLDAGVLAVGAICADVASVPDAGAVYTFSAITGQQLSKVTASTPVSSELFGFRVANSGEHTLVGARDYDGPAGSNQGTAYLFRGPRVTTYCVGAPNSAGPGARMSMTGSASVTESDLVLRVMGAPANSPGVFYYGSATAQLPFGNGFRCVSGSVARLPVVFTDVAGAAAQSFDPLAQAPQVSAGTTRHFQFWYRDPLDGGAHFNLSDALSVDFRP